MAIKINGDTVISDTKVFTATDVVMGTQINKLTLTYTTNTARTYTFPDAGANASMVMTAGNQTIDGTKTFSSTISGSINGNAATATTASQLGGIASSTYMRKDQTNLPSANNTYNLGSSTFKYNTVFATTFNGEATSALYADVAERYHSDSILDPGTVVCLGGANEITACNTEGCDQVFGIISTAPAIMMNSGAGSDETHPYVALVGRCPVKVIGVVNKGDRLMSSGTPGVATKWDKSTGPLTIIGRCLENKNNPELSLIEVVVGVR